MVLSEQQIKDKLDSFRGWEYTSGKLEKTYLLPSFSAAVEVLNKLAVICEKENHHLDLFIHDYNRLTVYSRTHSEDGITEKDFELVKQIENIMVLEV